MESFDADVPVLDLSRADVLRQLVDTVGDNGAFDVEFETLSLESRESGEEVYFAGSDMEAADDLGAAPTTTSGDDDEEQKVTAPDPVMTPPTARDYTWLWHNNASPPTPTTPEFTGRPGLLKTVEADASPLVYLKLLINDRMMEKIVQETNRYAAVYLTSATLSPNSRFKQWTATTVEEMWAFFSLITAMGLVVISDLDDYWSRDQLYGLGFFSSVMTRDRFMLILTFLHVNDNAAMPARDSPAFNPLFKVLPFLKHLQTSFRESYYPTQRLAVDEAMVAWRGPLHFKVYNPEKPDKFGMKVFMLCDSSNGYCSAFEVYSGKKPVSPKGATYDIVLRLLTPYLDAGHHLYVDNYYTSPVLFTDLLAKRTPACGTLRTNKTGVAAEMKGKKVVKTKGDVKVMTNGKLNHIKWMDKKKNQPPDVHPRCINGDH